MTDLFRHICKRLSLPFDFGGDIEFQAAVKQIQRDSTIPFVFYQEYEDVFFSSTSVGAIQDTMPFELSIVLPSAMNEIVAIRGPKVMTCRDSARRIFGLLDADYTVTGAKAVPMLSATASLMAGVRFTGTIKGDYMTNRCEY